MKKIARKVTDIDFFSQKSTLPTCPIGQVQVSFQEFLPDHEDFVSGMSFVSIYNNFEQS